MSYQNLVLSNFRSYKSAEFEFSSDINLIVGRNGSGKTNIIEALYLLAMTKSWRGTSQQLVKSQQPWYRVETKFAEQKILVKWQNEKVFHWQDKPISPQHLIGKIPLVLFEPGSLDMITGSPAVRRAFLDTTLSIIDPRYLNDLLRYRRALKQRNIILKHNGSADELFVWDVILVELAQYLVVKRRQLIDFINQRMPAKYCELSGTKDVVKIRYRSVVKADYASNLLRQLQIRSNQDKLMGGTSVGPHRDDMVIEYNQRVAKNRGSRGEIRTVVLALKLLQLEYFSTSCKTPPILLLDDVFSELDSSRQSLLISHINHYQTFITSALMPKNLKKCHIINLS